MCSYSGIERDPIPEHPSKEQAYKALSVLRSNNLRSDAISYYYEMLKRYIDSSKEYSGDE